ncbi:MAG: Sapep family Mn(2+)-dependent dipeptidase [Ignavibacteriales bacterium]|nr:Sapep family Mn(2+)-dependent dipeptidase [Ignavibacteriales bacterium]
MNRCITIILFFLIFISNNVSARENLASLLASRGSAMITEAKSAGTDSKAIYARFVERIAGELAESGDTTTAGKVRGAVKNHSTNFPRTEFAWITHTFAREYYKEEIIRETAELIKFKTYATDVPNRKNPEFIRQKEYLRSLAEKLGLKFNDVDGYVQEIWIGDGPESFGLMSHSDVQPVAPEEWSHDPWSGDVIDGKIWGRGAVDDKGPIVAIMYGMKALLDSGFPLKKKIILLVGTDEESENEDVAEYLKRKKVPDQTIVVDSNFPVICAEKGWCGIWLHIPKHAGSSKGKGLLVISLQSGFSASIVPERAFATIVSTKESPANAKKEIEKKIAAFIKRRSGAKINVTITGDTLVVTAWGKTVHSAQPEQGHNALMDLLVFLDNDLKVLPNAYGLMSKFAARYIGFELDGKSLGIAHTDDFMGSVSVAGTMFSTTDTTVMFMFNFRVPKGIDSATVVGELESRFEKFGKEHDFKFSDTRYISNAHYFDPKSPFVQKLLTMYNSVTKENRKAQSIGGGTYAHRLPNAVVFGPALPEEEYLGHQPNEYFLVSTLVKNIEILTHTMFEFGM